MMKKKKNKNKKNFNKKNIKFLQKGEKIFRNKIKSAIIQHPHEFKDHSFNLS